MGLAETLQTALSRLTQEQGLIFNRLCHNVDHDLREILFLDDSGGMEKTLLT